MLDWFVEWFKDISNSVVTMPIYLAAPMMVLIGALDSSLLSLPEVNDYITVARVANNPIEVYYFPLFPAIGSVIGCLALYRIARRGGQFVTKRFKPEHFEWARNMYRKWGVFALVIPALLPPPMPFKIFVATAGVLNYPPMRFTIVIMIARMVRYYFWGTLAYFFHEEVRQMLDWLGMHLIEVFGALVAAVVLFLIARWLFLRTRPPKPKTQVSYTD
ncbi:MAG: YqaA family protein [Blastocatellia bacterium]